MSLYVSVVTGFLVVFLAQLGMAVNVPTPDTAPLEEGSEVTPTVHSMNIAGGLDGSGVEIDNDGKMTIETTNLPGSYISPNYGMNIDSNKGGLHMTAPWNPIAAINAVKSSKTGPNEYGRVGIEGRVTGNETGAPEVTKGFLGHLRNSTMLSESNEYQPLGDSIPSLLVPYAFYTTGDTYLGDTVNIVGDITNSPGNPVSVIGDAAVEGNLGVGRYLDADYLNFSDADNLDARFGITTEISVGVSSTSVSEGTKFAASATCPDDEYLVGCTGYISGANNYAPYRGARLAGSAKGGECIAYARDPSDFIKFDLFAYAYCFNPH